MLYVNAIALSAEESRTESLGHWNDSKNPAKIPFHFILALRKFLNLMALVQSVGTGMNPDGFQNPQGFRDVKLLTPGCMDGAVF
jgi:hypothetical protein